MPGVQARKGVVRTQELRCVPGKYCTAQCLAAGVVPISDNWPCAYWNETAQQFLIVYVDDMKLAGPTHFMVQAWDALGRGITLEQPRGNTPNVMTFLGCEQRLVEREV